MRNQLDLTLRTGTETRSLSFEVEHAWNGGWAGRDQEAVRLHAAELAEQGVEAPTAIPILFPVSNNLITTTDSVQVISGESSGEVEYALLLDGGHVYVTVASDHTDRGFERHGVQASKQLYPNVIAAEVWPYEECAKHWDELVLRCWVSVGGQRRLYQEARMAALLSAADWLRRLDAARIEHAAVAFLSGTPTTIGGLVCGDAYDLELEDPVLGRAIRHRYSVEVLPDPVTG